MSEDLRPPDGESEAATLPRVGTDRSRTSPKTSESSSADSKLQRSSGSSGLLAIALKLLSMRGYSEAGLRRRIIEKVRPETQHLDECIARLVELGYIDDHKFARSYASHRIGLKPVGRSRLARELASRRVSRAVIEKALEAVFEDVDEEALVDRAIEKRMRTHGPISRKQDLKRLFDHLIRLGFSRELIFRRVRKLKPSQDALEADTD